jgi:hypothetical protein
MQATNTAQAQVKAVTSESYPIQRAGRSKGSTSTGSAFDGDPGTAWMTNAESGPPESGYVFFDLGEVTSIGRIDWLLGLDGGADLYQVQISNNRRDWFAVAELGGETVGEWQSVSLETEGRYIRFVFRNPSGSAQIGGLAEVAIYP